MSTNTAPAGPAISVIMPVYNGQEYLREAIDSILGQTFIDFELILINDGSSDQSQAIIDSYQDPRIRSLINPKNLGVVGALNVGLKAARGRYWARQDQDDRSH
jgi:glycosyltransferase involved in cell wall biosynthesis